MLGIAIARVAITSVGAGSTVVAFTVAADPAGGGALPVATITRAFGAAGVAIAGAQTTAAVTAADISVGGEPAAEPSDGSVGEAAGEGKATSHASRRAGGLLLLAGAASLLGCRW